MNFFYSRIMQAELTVLDVSPGLRTCIAWAVVPGEHLRYARTATLLLCHQLLALAARTADASSMNRYS